VPSKLSRTETKVLDEVTSRWSLIAHEGQIPPADRPWFVYLMRSGRGGGKTRAGSEWVLQRVREGYKHIALVGRTAADVRDIMIELGPSSILKVARPNERPIYEPSKRRLTFPSGAIATAYNGDEPDDLRGPAHDSAWVDELAKFRYAQDLWDNLTFGLREGKNPQIFVTTTPRPLPIIKSLLKEPDTIDIRFSTYANKDNLSPIFLKKIEDKYKGTRLGRQEIDGEILEDNPGALWKRDLIEAQRVNVAPKQLIRIAIGADPAVTSNPDSDETGIIAAGLDAVGHAYILDDASLQGTPLEWGTAIVRCYDKNRADRVIGETNNGGELIERNIRVIRPNISYEPVHASRGKQIRAEPVSAVYEQGKVHHVGTFPALEDQMCEWVPGQPSPDRMDALVWVLTKLMGLDETIADSSRFLKYSSA
jgi:phage terminase large subunit-like protein